MLDMQQETVSSVHKIDMPYHHQADLELLLLPSVRIGFEFGIDELPQTSNGSHIPI